jgi:hypothetical protein
MQLDDNDSADRVTSDVEPPPPSAEPMASEQSLADTEANLHLEGKASPGAAEVLAEQLEALRGKKSGD